MLCCAVTSSTSNASSHLLHATLTSMSSTHLFHSLWQNDSLKNSKSQHKVCDQEKNYSTRVLHGILPRHGLRASWTRIFIIFFAKFDDFSKINWAKSEENPCSSCLQHSAFLFFWTDFTLLATSYVSPLWNTHICT